MCLCLSKYFKLFFSYAKHSKLTLSISYHAMTFFFFYYYYYYFLENQYYIIDKSGANNANANEMYDFLSTRERVENMYKKNIRFGHR